MYPKKIGVLKPVPIREAWPNEAYDFTTWMLDNISVLGDAIGVELTSAESEKAAGTFSADIVALAADGRTVVVENQYNKSNHDHLGKLLTYLVSFDADCAVWVVEEPRPEHVAVIAWLNEQGSVDAYMVKVQAIRIDDSLPAPLFTLITGPDEDSKLRGEQKQNLKERHHLRFRFWEQLIPLARNTLLPTAKPSYRNFIGKSAGVPGLSYNYAITAKGTKAELYIDRGDKVLNERTLDYFLEHRHEIEQAVLGPVSWQRLEAKKACRIAVLFENYGYGAPEDDWRSLIVEMVDGMERLQSALAPRLTNAPRK